jgi:DNA-binding FadR family transcriptional regulator
MPGFARVEPTPDHQVIRRVPLYQQVAEHFQGLISSGKIRVGDRLPTEDELARQFGVSRTVVREAVKALRERGLVDVSPGRGTIVTQPSLSFLAEAVSSLFNGVGDITVENYIELRALLERQIARLAVERATDDDLARLETSLARGQETGIGDSPFDANLAFHLDLAAATHNPLFATLVQVLIGQTNQISRAVYERVSGADERIKAIHMEIFERVRARDADGAEEAARRHMDDVRRNYTELGGQAALSVPPPGRGAAL